MAKIVKIIGSVLSLICLGAIVYLSLRKGVTIPDFVVGEDKGAHFLAYIALSFLFFVSFSFPVKRRFVRYNILPVLAASSLSFVIGYTIELVQPFFGRSFELYDLLADGLGSLAGSLIGFFCVFLVCAIERHKSRE